MRRPPQMPIRLSLNCKKTNICIRLYGIIFDFPIAHPIIKVHHWRYCHRQLHLRIRFDQPTSSGSEVVSRAAKMEMQPYIGNPLLSNQRNVSHYTQHLGISFALSSRSIFHGRAHPACVWRTVPVGSHRRHTRFKYFVNASVP